MQKAWNIRTLSLSLSLSFGESISTTEQSRSFRNTMTFLIVLASEFNNCDSLVVSSILKYFFVSKVDNFLMFFDDNDKVKVITEVQK